MHRGACFGPFPAKPDAIIRLQLSNGPGNVEIVHIPGHVGIHRNGIVDDLSKQGACAPCNVAPSELDMQGVKGLRAMYRPVLPPSGLTGLVGWDPSSDEGDGNRKDDSRLSQVLMEQSVLAAWGCVSSPLWNRRRFGL